ncbi:MAG: hypothetical protein CSA45_04850 [Gammaproteobacteria bacterium]|nr:MAG: hypothetical protein CSA45_04850 [Gammaproteobacteria bacterium]
MTIRTGYMLDAVDCAKMVQRYTAHRANIFRHNKESATKPFSAASSELRTEKGGYLAMANCLIRLSLAITLLFTLFSAAASFNVYPFNQADKEARFQHLINDLRCPKCQNNNLADSNAPLATDIKNYVYESVKKGKSNDEITDFLISRYGLFIVYDPKVIWLWLLPLLIVLGGFIWTVRHIKSEPVTVADNLPHMADLIAEHEYNKDKKCRAQKHRQEKRS